jgi:hypothetical protein
LIQELLYKPEILTLRAWTYYILKMFNVLAYIAVTTFKEFRWEEDESQCTGLTKLSMLLSTGNWLQPDM